MNRLHVVVGNVLVPADNLRSGRFHGVEFLFGEYVAAERAEQSVGRQAAKLGNVFPIERLHDHLIQEVFFLEQLYAAFRISGLALNHRHAILLDEIERLGERGNAGTCVAFVEPGTGVELREFRRRHIPD